MYQFFIKRGLMGALILGIVAVAISMLSLINGIKGAGFTMSDDLNAAMKNNPDLSFDFINPAINIVLLLIAVAVIAWLVFGLFGLVSNPKGSLKAILAALAIVIVLFVLYTMSVSETSGPISELIQKNNISEGISKMITAGTKGAWYLAILSFVIIVVLELRNLFK
jgi:glucan phosphoethanolaminetransferase (alkaline phosphatase superfamily)